MVDRQNEREDRNALLAQRQQQLDQQAQQAQQEQKRADLPMLGRLLGSIRDEPTYQQARQVATEYGIDISGAPPNYDPNWVSSQTQLVQMMSTPQGQAALSTAGKQAQDAGFTPGTPEFVSAVRNIITADVAQPYMGSQGETRLYQPDVFGGGQQAQPFNPDEWEVVEEGGPASQAPGGFPYADY
jgi:hypothetical protein